MLETIWLFQNEEYFKCFEPNILSECDSRKNAFDLFYFSTKVASTGYPDHNGFTSFLKLPAAQSLTLA